MATRVNRITRFTADHRPTEEASMPRIDTRSSYCVVVTVLVTVLVAGSAWAAEPPVAREDRPQAPATTGPENGPASADPAARDERFRTLVDNVRLSGQFTIDGQENGNLHREEYLITGARKIGDRDGWVVTARITFGEVDLAVPVPVQVQWAGDTPVIVLDKITIPGLGTFSARVLLDGNRYAGTWSHDDKGGHLFGSIAPARDAPAATPNQTSPRAAPEPLRSAP
jgi:hypothetical protein